MNVIELAKQAGFWQEHINTWMCTTQDIERFAHLVRAAALEEAVGVIDAATRYEDWELLGGAEGKELCGALAAAVRQLMSVSDGKDKS